MQINVTQKHIQAGKPKKHLDCPITLAFKAKGFQQISIHLTEAYYAYPMPDRLVITTDGVRTIDRFIIRWIPLPKEATAFIRAFDAGDTVEPFTFEIEH